VTNLTRGRYWGIAVDQLLAGESADDGTPDDVAWALTDHLNSVRDLVEYSPDTATASVIKHATYDAVGNLTSDSASAVESFFLFTARPYDTDTRLQNNLNRWYEPATGRWMSTDPIGFEAGDGSLHRYVGNGVVAVRDPSGQAAIRDFVGRLCCPDEMGRLELLVRRPDPNLPVSVQVR
jgi:RHS repeat-associated protein